MVTGLEISGDKLYAGSWNGVYCIDRKTGEMESLISNRLMMNLHGIAVTPEYVVTVLTAKDTVVISDYHGKLLDWFEVRPNLNLYRDKSICGIDWRFVSKMFRGSCGYWHFNNVQVLEPGRFLLTSRSASCLVEVNTNTGTAELRLMDLMTPVLLHDGNFIGGKWYFTSVDGKILIAEESSRKNKTCREGDKAENMYLYNRDLVAKLIRLDETKFGREPNWCRGIAVYEDEIFVTVDGRYDSELAFGLLGLRENGTVTYYEKLHWNQVGKESEIRYVTGFDIAIFPDKF